MNKYKYRLSYTAWYSSDHLSVDSDDYHQEFNTLEEALKEYINLKAKNGTIDWPRNNFRLIKYKEVELCENQESQ
jgi:hypothetical protein